MSSQSESAASNGTIVPVIDMSDFFNGDSAKRLEIAKKIGKACEDIGFFVIKGHNVPQPTIDTVWKTTKEFFDLGIEEKLPFDLDQNVYPFGYTRLGGEILSTGKSAEQHGKGSYAVVNSEALPDLKEMFSIGPSNPLAGYPSRIYPSNPSNFGPAWDLYYDTLSKLAESLLEAFALSLDLREDFFKQFIDHHASALRALNYPSLDISNINTKNQFRASAHTDYGILTILRADGPGLQVSKDKNPPTWHDVPVVEDGFIVNLGDLMKRWTNDKWLSTLHQVIVAPAELKSASSESSTSPRTARRQSMAFFYNVNKDAVISNLMVNEECKYEPIIAGDFLMAKHLAATGATPSSTAK